MSTTTITTTVHAFGVIPFTPRSHTIQRNRSPSTMIGLGRISTSTHTTSSYSSSVRFGSIKDDDDYDDTFDVEDLQRRIEEQRILEENRKQQPSFPNDPNAPNAELFTTSSSSSVEAAAAQTKPKYVYIVVYNPDSEEQGVHTFEVPKGSGINFILAFENELECAGFCASLREQAFFDPKVQEIEFATLEEHCESLPKVSPQLIPTGTNLSPPKERVDELGMNPNRDIEVDYVDYLYRLSSSTDGRGGMGLDDGDGALFSNDDDRYGDSVGGGGGSWE